MDITTIFTDVFNTVPWKTIAGIISAAIFLAILKRYYDNISSYLMFRSNRDLGKNVKVCINGQEGFITQISWRFIYVRLIESGNELIIPITKWTNQRWEIYKNGKS